MRHCRHRPVGRRPVLEHEIRAHVRRHGPPRPRRRRRLPRRRRGPRHAPPEHHRPRRRPSADLQRGRLGLDRLQRRDLQLPRAAPRPDRARPHASARRATPKPSSISTRIFGAALRRAPARHVRASRSGTCASAQLLLARDRLGIKPLYYAERDGELLFASELKPILQLAGVDRSLNWEAVGHLFTFLATPATRASSTAFASSSRRASAIARRRPSAAHRALLGRRVRAERERHRRRARRAAARAARRIGHAPPGQRRAGRRVPERRHRLERRRRHDGEAGGRTPEDVLDRLRRSRLRRARRTRGPWRRSSAPITTTSSCGPTSSRSSRT